jgi:hypothetical protein
LSAVLLVSKPLQPQLAGAKNNLGAALTNNTSYLVSFSIKATSADSVKALYLPTGTTADASTGTCTTTAVAITTSFTKVNCVLTTVATASSAAAAVAISGTAASNTYYIDNLSITAQQTGANNSLTGGQLRVGGISGQGLTLFTVDNYAGRPTTSTTINAALLGSMYYDTTLGKMQCYEAGGWGYCGASPDVSVNLVPEYTGAVLDGTGIGSLTSDLCANIGSLSVNTALCSAGQSFNYYNWTTIQPTAQSYSVYIRYQLPATYASIAASNPVTLTARSTDVSGAGASQNGVKFSMYDAAGAQCGSTQILGTANAWTPLQISSLAGCSLAANTIVVFKIDVTATSSSTSYLSNLSFLVKGQ